MTVERKNISTKGIMEGINAAIAKVSAPAKVAVVIAGASAVVGCGQEELNLPPKPDDKLCYEGQGEWEWEQDDKVWSCELDSDKMKKLKKKGVIPANSTGNTLYVFNGMVFNNRSDLHKSSSYQAYRTSAKFQSYGNPKSTTTGGAKGGFGSSSKSGS